MSDQPHSGWNGIILAANTPFAEAGSLDIGCIPPFADYLASAGCEAILLRGVAAETAYLDQDERTLLVRSFVEATRGRFDLIGGLSASDPDDLVKETRQALNEGVTAINWRPPPSIGEPELTGTLSAIASAGATKIMLQDFDIAGPGIPVEFILAAHRQVGALVSIKIETIDNLAKSSAIAAAVERPFNICAGWPVTGTIAALDAGVHGFMPTSLAPLMQHIYRLHRDGQRAPAVEFFDQLGPLHAFMSASLGRSIAVNKLLRQREGIFATGMCRHPEARLDAAEREAANGLVDSAVRLQAGICKL